MKRIKFGVIGLGWFGEKHCEALFDLPQVELFALCTRRLAFSPDTTYWPLSHGVPSGALREELAYFANCLLAGNKPEIVTPEEALEAVRACLAAEESAAKGSVVRIR